MIEIFFQRLVDFGRDDLVDATKCLFPCRFMEYKVSCVECGRNDTSLASVLKY